MDTATPMRQLWAMVERDERSLASLVDCLKRERDCIASFDVANLLDVVNRKAELLESFRRHADDRRQVLASVWAHCGAPSAMMPDDVADVLRELAAYAGMESARLVHASERFKNMFLEMTQLHEVNQSLVQRSLSWLDSYLSDLMGRTPADTYNAGGRVVPTRNHSFTGRA